MYYFIVRYINLRNFYLILASYMFVHFYFCYAYLITSCRFMHLYLWICIHVYLFIAFIYHALCHLYWCNPSNFYFSSFFYSWTVWFEFETCFHNKHSEKGLIWRMAFHTRIFPIPNVWLVILGLSSLLIKLRFL